MGSALLVKIHISFTQKWAGGHRYSLRRNVCHPATDAHTCIYNCKNKKNRHLPVQISRKKNVIVHIIPLRILSIALVFR